MNEAQVLIGMVQCYMEICTRRSHILAPLIKVSSAPKYRAIIWNYNLEVAFREIKYMVSTETLLDFPD